MDGFFGFSICACLPCAGAMLIFWGGGWFLFSCDGTCTFVFFRPTVYWMSCSWWIILDARTISSCREGHGHRISLHAQRDAADHDWPPSARAPGIPTSTHQYPTCTWKCKKRTLHIEPSDLRGSEASGHYNSQMKIKEDPAHWALRFARGQASVQGLGHWETQNRHWETQVKLLYIQNLISGMTTIKTLFPEWQ